MFSIRLDNNQEADVANFLLEREELRFRDKITAQAVKILDALDSIEERGEEVTLLIIESKELGFVGEASRKYICRVAMEEYGLEMCPPEMGIRLWLHCEKNKIATQNPNQWFVLGMQAVNTVGLVVIAENGQWILAGSNEDDCRYKKWQTWTPWAFILPIVGE